MKINDRLAEWMVTRDYDEGARIYSEIGPYRNLRQLFFRKKMPEKMEYEMLKLCKQYKVTPKKAKTPLVQKPQVLVIKAPEPAVAASHLYLAPWRMPYPEDIPEIVALKTKFRSLLDERRLLHAGALVPEKSEAERGVTAFRILDIKDELDQVDFKLKYYYEKKRLPIYEVKPKCDDTDRASIQKRLALLIIYLRRYRPESKQAHAIRWQAYKAEYDKLVKLL